ncbi:carboxypeptidase regulatory-like domain-containing protein [Methylomonas lenta]|nr:carboxypeptidase regulatory-like domain-containing protein [Methylomonas lenta]
MKIRFIIPWAMLSFLVFAKDPLIKLQTQGEISFVSGGVGGDERDAMHAIRSDYNLNLLFSEAGSGEYLSDIKVCIKDAGGNNLLETIADGPMFYTKLKPGRYTVSVDLDGNTIDKTVNVGNQQSVSHSFTWPKQQGN